jgi:hypothetical protein
VKNFGGYGGFVINGGIYNEKGRVGCAELIIKPILGWGVGAIGGYLLS